MKSILLGAAGLIVRVISSEKLLDMLAVRYTGFLLETGAADLEVKVNLERGSERHLHVSPSFSIADRAVLFDLPGYVGFIDPGRGAALRLASQTPGNSVDYFLRVAFALLAHRAGGLMIHAAGIVRQARAYLFFGPSGSGKTTVARNSPLDRVLNDDLIVLLPDSGGWRAFGSPFTSPTQTKPAPESAPAAALLRLMHSPRVYLEPLEGAQAVAELLASAPVLNAFPSPPLDRCQMILREIPAFELHLRPDASFWPLVEKF